ncbi:MAG: GntR family transcriptional regulator, partial [Clostridiales bacterium]|nr:GntR family transcriptional regulator [Clostridiales bacterium]
MIRTYELSHESKTPLYVQLYEAIRADILSGSLPGGEKLPSKRALAEHLSLSKITVETAYAQLLDEGYLTSRERSGYFIAHMPLLAKAPARHTPETTKAPEIAPQQNAAAELFPFSVWAKLMRSVILDEGQYLLQPVPNGGLLPLRQAIAGELARQRGLVVQPEQILIGAGTEYFYALLAQFL